MIYDSVTLVDQCEGHTGTPAGPSGGAAGGPSKLAVAGAKLDRRGRIVVRFTAPGPGRATARARARRIAVGSGSRAVSQAGNATLAITPSRAARRALRAHRRLKVTLRVAFKPAGGGAAVRLTKAATLRR